MLDTETSSRRPRVSAPFGRALDRLVRDRDDVVVVTADLSKWTDILPFADAHPDRFIQVGMAEQNLIGVTAGLAKSGHLPIAVTFGVFASRRAYDQIAMSLATRPTHAIIAGFLPGLDSRFRGTHQAIDDVALLSSLPGLTVLDPADATELELAVVAAAEADGVVYVRCHRGMVEQLFDPDEYDFEIGSTASIASGDGRLGVVTTGAATRWVVDAVTDDGVEADSISHLHTATLKPFPTDRIAEFCRAHDRVVTVENHLIDGGLGTAVAATIADNGLECSLTRLGIDDRWGCYGTPEFSRRELGLDARALASTFTRLVGEAVVA